MQPDITLTVPGKVAETTTILYLDHNPLYSFKFKSEYAINQVQTELNWEKSSAWAESKRCPEADGRSNQEISNVQIGTFREFKWQTFELLTTVHSFDEFTCQAWKTGLAPPSFNSVESMHNNVHNYTGTNDTVINDQNTKRLGNMTDVQASSFDPIFWLHHVNCDRLTAIWQALNTEITIPEIKSLTPRYNAATGTVESGTSNLEPWHKTTADDLTDYFIANDTKELSSTFLGGYYYPETPLQYITDPVRMKSFAMAQVYALYGPAGLSPPKPPPKSQVPTNGRSQNGGPRNGAPTNGGAHNGTPISGPSHTLPVPAHNILSGHTIQHWQTFLRVKNFALSGAWAVHVFFGEPPEGTQNWFLSDARVGSVTMLASKNCANCRDQAANEILVTGSVPLNESLGDKGVDVNDTDAVVDYLKKNLTWRVVKASVTQLYRF